MIKIDCNKDNTGSVMFRGDPNMVLNEIRYIVRYSILVLGPEAVDAINDGLSDVVEELEAKHDKGNRTT